MRIILLTSLLLFLKLEIFCCPSAHQNRLFLLGHSDKGFVFVETSLHRSLDRNGNKFEMPAKWHGYAFLKTYDKEFRMIESTMLDSLTMSDKTAPQKFLEKFIGKGLERMQKTNGFETAKPIYFSYCDFRRKCDEAKIMQANSSRLSIELKNGKKTELKIIHDSLSIAGEYIRYYSGFNDGIIDWKKLYIGSVRKFSVAGKTITIVHLSSGDEETHDGKPYPPGKEHKPSFEFNRIEQSAFYEPLLYHGHGFDFFTVE
jgi:hypothetical protein